jgi:hypothetical protein
MIHCGIPQIFYERRVLSVLVSILLISPSRSRAGDRARRLLQLLSSTPSFSLVAGKSLDSTSGTYRLSSTLAFSAAAGDGGTNGYTVSYQAVPGADPCSAAVSRRSSGLEEVRQPAQGQDHLYASSPMICRSNSIRLCGSGTVTSASPASGPIS